MSASRKTGTGRLARRCAGLAAGGIAVLAAFAGAAGATQAPQPTDRPTVFIVTCRCAAAADRQRLAKAVRRQGGSIVYMYDTLAGLAVVSPRGADAGRFSARLRRLPSVTDVQASGTQRLQSSNDQPMP